MREFGQLESAIMEVIWSQDRPLLVREVRDRLHYARPVAYTTVMTVMTILHGKGVLSREKQGRAWRYWPQEQRFAHDARLMAEILRSAGDSALTMREFMSRLTEDELETVRDAADRRAPVSRAAVG